MRNADIGLVKVYDWQSSGTFFAIGIIIYVGL